MTVIGGLIFTLVCVFGSFALTGGSVIAILEGLPFELLTIVGAAIGAFAMGNSLHVMKATMSGMKSILACSTG
jgi:chemotaxis protein MotA